MIRVDMVEVNKVVNPVFMFYLFCFALPPNLVTVKVKLQKPGKTVFE